MKRSLLVIPAVLAVAGMTNAADRKISDLMYMPKAGGMFYSTEFAMSSGEYKDDGTKYDTSSFVWENTFNYSFTDNLDAGLGLNYTFTDKVELGSSEYKNKGLQNIDLHARYRVMEEAPVTLDLKAGLSVRPGDAETTYLTNKEGNVYGPHAFRFAAEVGKKHGDYQWKGNLGLVQNFEYDVKALGASNGADLTVTQESSTDFNFGLAGSYRLAPAFDLGVNANFLFIGEQKSNAQTQDSYTDISLGFDAKYEVTEKILTKFKFDYLMGGEFDTTPVGGAKTTTKDRSDMRFALGADFSF